MQNLSVSFEPLLPLGLIALLAVPTAALIIWALLGGSRGAWLRGAALLALSAALLNPVILQEDRVALPTTVAIIVDESQSQRLGERSADTEAALAQLQQNLERFPQFDVRVARTGAAGDDGPNTQTELFATLQGALRDVAPARIGGAIMITDGQVHDMPDDMASLGFDAPLHGLITGTDDEFDRRVEVVQAPRFSIINQPLTINYRIVEQGAAPTEGGPLAVQIFRNGDLIGEEVATVGDTFDFEMELDRAGKNIIEIAVETDESELTDSNNRAVLRIEGIRENLRVLLVSGEPHSGERAWRNLLKSDASVDLVHFTILRPPEKQDGTPINELSLIAFPTRELFVEKIEDFDLIIFDRYQNRNVLPLLYYDYISQYVRDGGALLIAAGPEYAGDGSIAETPLISALPALPVGTIAEAGFRPAITDQGARHPVTRDLADQGIAQEEWGRWFRMVDVEDTEGTVVMSGADDRPLLVLNRFGEGRVGLMLSDHGWLWARGFEGGGPYLNLYRRTAHWLMREPDLEEETLSAEGTTQTLTITRQTMAETAGDATIVTPSGNEIVATLTQDEPGIFKADINIDEIGLYRITNGDLNALASIGPVDAPEFREMISTTELLDDAVAGLGGTVQRLRDGGGLSVPNIVPVRSTAAAAGRDWIGLKTTQETRLVGVNRQPLFAGFLGLALMLLALASMWWREGR
ncbi:MAG: hypothetical protein WA921_11210 [Ahrensia sp.]